MEGIEKLTERALDMKKAGMSEKEIEGELHLSAETIHWMLSGRTQSKKPPTDVFIGWRSIGVRGMRVNMLCEIIADIIKEEATNRRFEFNTVVGLGMNGVPLAQATASILDKDFAILSINEDTKESKIFSNFAGLKDKNVVIVDDVISSGKTMQAAIEMLDGLHTKAMLGVVIVNKTKRDDIKGVPVRALIRTMIV